MLTGKKALVVASVEAFCLHSAAIAKWSVYSTRSRRNAFGRPMKAELCGAIVAM
jgi:hypothetical protein